MTSSALKIKLMKLMVLLLIIVSSCSLCCGVEGVEIDGGSRRGSVGDVSVSATNDVLKHCHSSALINGRGGVAPQRDSMLLNIPALPLVKETSSAYKGFGGCPSLTKQPSLKL